MEDYLIRAITTNKEIRALAVKSTDTVSAAQILHNTTPVATAALGRVITAAVLVGSMVKSGDEISIKVEGDGPAGNIAAEANQYGEVRGYISNPDLEFYRTPEGKLNVAKAVGNGQLSVTKKMKLKEPYTGSVPLVSGEIGEDLSYYFTASEQIPSAVGLGVLVEKDLTVRAAGGFIVQLMPDASEETVDMLEKNIEQISSVSRLIESGLKPEELLEKILDGFDFRVMASKKVEFKCSCSRDGIYNLISGLGEEELKEALAEQGKVEVKCHFCSSIYSFSREEIEELLKETAEGD